MQADEDEQSESSTFRVELPGRTRNSGSSSAVSHFSEALSTSALHADETSLALWQRPHSVQPIGDDRGEPAESYRSPNKAASGLYPTAARISPELSYVDHLSLTKKLKNAVFLPSEISSARLSRQQFVVNACSLFVPEDQAVYNRNGEYGPHWATNIQLCIADQSDVVEQSLHSLCLLQVACLRQDEGLLRASRSHYAQALEALRVLSRSADTLWRQLFMSAMILGTYELFDGTGDRYRGMLCHVRGASSYLRRFTRYDESMADMFYYSFLETECIFKAMCERKASPLSSSSWWRRSIDLYAGKTYGSLLRLITPLPALLEQLDYLTNLPVTPETRDEKITLLQYSLLLENHFKDWFEDVVDNVPDFFYDDAGDLEIIADIPRPCTSDVQYSFPNLWVARLYLLYWTAVILLLQAMIALVVDLSNLKSYSTVSSSVEWALRHPVVVEHMVTQAKMFATNIRRSVAYCLYPSNGLLGKSIIINPLSVASSHLLKVDEKQARWCTSVLGQIAQDPGCVDGKLHSLASNNCTEVLKN